MIYLLAIFFSQSAATQLHQPLRLIFGLSWTIDQRGWRSWLAADLIIILSLICRQEVSLFTELAGIPETNIHVGLWTVKLYLNFFLLYIIWLIVIILINSYTLHKATIYSLLLVHTWELSVEFEIARVTNWRKNLEIWKWYLFH